MCDTMNLLERMTQGISISISEVLVRSGGLEPPRVLPHSDLNAEWLATYCQELKEFLQQDFHTYNCQYIRELTTIHTDVCHDV